MDKLQSIDNITLQLQAASKALGLASTDFERVKLRDNAKALAAAAAILRHKEVQNKATALMHLANIAIIKANPPNVTGRPKKEEEKSREAYPDFFGQSIRDTRKVYGTDETKLNALEAVMHKALATGEEVPSNTEIKKETQQIQRDTNRAERDEILSANNTKLPTGEQKYSVIYADPPWQYTPAETTRQVENHYPTMPLTEIMAVDVQGLCNNDCALFLWATSGLLPQALEVLNAWGFAYVSSAVWNKQKVGMGYWFRGQHEFLLVGKKGGMPPPKKEDRVSSVFQASRSLHSRKPVEVAEWIEQAYPTQAKIELFSRQPRKGWDVWGNEAHA